MTERQPTIYDVAQRAGVSIATVSRALSGGSISEGSRRKVEEAAAALGYRTMTALRAGEASRPGKRTVAIVLSSVHNPYNAMLLSGAADEVARHGFLPQYYAYPETTLGEQIVSDVLAQQPAGVLLAGFPIETSATDSLREGLTRLQQALPLVAIGPPLAGFQCSRLTSDPAACVSKAVRHLAQLGHRRIAMLGGTHGIRFSDLREQRFYEETEAVGGPIPPHFVQLTGFTAQSGKIGAELLLGACTAEDRPTALFAINDLVALGAMQQLRAAGLRIPQDMSIIGCDNDFFAPYLDPPLSTVDLHPYNHGQQAIAELMIAMGDDRPYSFERVCECTLIIRESCAGVPLREENELL